MKILAIGDTHGVLTDIVNVGIAEANRVGAKVIVQCGDFGYLGKRDELSGSRFLDKISKWMVRSGIQFYWLDGNHDNHMFLWENYPPDDSGMVPMRDNVTYLPRGCVWEWDDVRFMSVGGAFSIDKEDRLRWEQKRGVQHAIWWSTELLTFEQRDFAATRGPVDCMFTHDCPDGVDIPGTHANDKTQFWQSWANREKMTYIVKRVKPRLLVHGHYHVRYSSFLDWREQDGWYRVQVEGLNCNGGPGFAIHVDTETFRRDTALLGR